MMIFLLISVGTRSAGLFLESPDFSFNLLDEHLLCLLHICVDATTMCDGGTLPPVKCKYSHIKLLLLYSKMDLLHREFLSGKTIARSLVQAAITAWAAIHSFFIICRWNQICIRPRSLSVLMDATHKHCLSWNKRNPFPWGIITLPPKKTSLRQKGFPSFLHFKSVCVNL